MARPTRNKPVALTDAFAKAAVCLAERKEEMYKDTDFPAFWLRVMPTGSKSWLVNSRGVGQKAFGTPGDMRAADARVKARQILGQLTTGEQVKVEKMTLRLALEMFPQKQAMAATYQKGMTTTLTIYGADLLDTPLSEISQKTALATFEAASARSLRQGDLLKTYASRLCKSVGVPSPWVGIKNRYEGSSTPPFAIPFDKWANMLDSIEELKNHTSRHAILTSIFTGFRPEAVVAMEWRHLKLDKDNAAYHIGERAVGFKNGRVWDYPLPEYLAKILRKRKERYGAWSEWVFFSPSDSAKHLVNFRESVESLRVKLDIPQLIPYNFRDTRGTYVEQFFGDTFITQRILNHRPDYSPNEWGSKKGQKVEASESTGEYILTKSEEIRDYCERFADIILELAGRQPMSKAVRETFIEKKAVALVERGVKLPDDFGRLS